MILSNADASVQTRVWHEWGSLSEQTRHPQCLTWAKSLGSSAQHHFLLGRHTIWQQLCSPSLLLLKEEFAPPHLVKPCRVSSKWTVSTWSWISQLLFNKRKKLKVSQKKIMQYVTRRKIFFKEVHYKVVDHIFIFCVVQCPEMKQKG